jgi:tRNA-specific 2-thiouridylase
MNTATIPDLADLFQLSAPLSDKRIVVAMSGGVDSSVVAALAARSGAEVIGVTLQLYDRTRRAGRKGACCAGDDIRDARSVADRLGIAHYVIDHESQFREEVVERFADEYLAGRTPIPCIRCNMGPKFTDLFAMARELGADCLATGHYVRRVDRPGGRLNCTARSIRRATRATSFTAPPKRSSISCAFRLGGLPKPQVRAIAEAEGLRVAAKPDSQDICFVPDGDYAKIVRASGPKAAPGRDRSCGTTGEGAGAHRGVIHYTVGQRRGLEIGGQPEPLYVTGYRCAGTPRAGRSAPDAGRRRRGSSKPTGSGHCPGEVLTAKVRSLAKPVPVTLEGSLRGRRRHDPLRPA